MRNDYKFENLNLDEANIFELQEALEQGTLTSKDLVFYYLGRIAEYDQDGPHINAIMEINPDSIFLAEALDLERKYAGRRGLLHGIPILLKDNIGTHDKMHTSAGALALAQHISPEDACIVSKLREAGAILLGKTNMTEWANGISSSMWAGYSSRGGQVAHPYGEFFVGGSSTGSAAAAAMNFAAAAVGTETSASILSPAVQMSVVGIKPTVGLISRTGIIPYSYSQDTAGPMARTVSNAAILLGVLAGRDESDPATWRYDWSDREQDYTRYLNVEGLHGAKIGVYSELPEHVKCSGEYDEFLFNQVISDLTKAGAQVVKPIEIPSFHGPWKYNKINMEFKHGIQNFLHNLPAHMPIHTLSELINWNQNHEEQALRYGQDILEYRESLADLLNDREYIQESILDLHLARQEGIDYAIERYQLDAIMFPAYIGADLSARAGYPSIAVPAGYMENGRPFGITFAGKAFSEPTLIAIAYSFEQHTKHRKQPVFD
ncbi:amidase family protein [Paenibacillus jilunlii]|uniref:Amidase n=1 Tax=Paenibacillus jilunlii TaxID=682956 RepID=A0A1G9KZB4_9BACL|nr:amidase family protein [Paenibacillus jilunlii]KWX69786.1 amidase [Paenibacillus jilunlii]SDL55032.1 amidase [Paenibacillus jilunlii]